MKRIDMNIWLSVLLYVSTLMWSGCDDDLGINNSSLNVREGIPVEIKLDINSQNPGQISITRADEENDGVIYDLYVLIFNSDRKLKTTFYRSYANLATSQTVNIITTSGESYIFAIANVHAGVPAEYNVTELAAKLNSLHNTIDETFTIDNLKELTVSLSEKNPDIINRTQARYVLSGKFMPSSGTDQGDGYCIIPETNTTLSGSVPLYRTDAKITFNLYMQSTKGVFTPTTYRVVNIPLHSRIINEAEDFDGSSATSGNSENYYSIAEADARNVIKEVLDENNTAIYRTFTFYMPENRKASKQKGISNYHDREKQVKDTSGKNGDWVYAPDYGTYVILSGHFVGTDDSGQMVDANVQYKIHLGNFSNEDWSNFKTSRNTSYTYNVYVNGVNNIVVEVNTGEEKQPGATGDVYYTNETNLYTLDAHFEKCLMVFSYNQLKAYNDDNQINYLVSTPFTSPSVQKADDAAWVQFMTNDQDYYGGYKDDLKAYNPEKVIGVETFIQTLKDMAENENHSNWDENKQYKVTCFVNEYYYSNDESESGWIEQYRTPVGADIDKSVPAWKYAVNQPNRKLQILCNIRSSADGESSIIDAAYVVSQRSIQTFYNADVSVTGLTSALGLETINETGPLSMGSPSVKPEDLRDGLYNTIAMWKGDNIIGGSWSTFINSAQNGYLTTAQSSGYMGLDVRFRGAYIACLQRNRDEDGDGVINEDEVKWYMPALNQYAAFFIGAEALSRESRFYTYSDWRLIHYYSSTYANRDGLDVMTVWAEEGFSNSTAKQADGWYNGAHSGGSGIGQRYYRCVRNVGNIVENSAGGKRPQNYWYKDNTRNIIYFTYLSPAALRQVPVTSGELDYRHTERTTSNRIYNTLAIANSDASETCTGAEARDMNNTVCASFSEGGVSAGKWRIPNHRELLFMTLNGMNGTKVLTNFPAKTWNSNSYRGYHSRTLFTWSSVFGTYYSPLDNKQRYGYRVESNGNMSITNGSGDELYVRCVRDVTE